MFYPFSYMPRILTINMLVKRVTSQCHLSKNIKRRSTIMVVNTSFSYLHWLIRLLLLNVLEWKFHNFCNEMVGRADLTRRWKIHITSKWSQKNPFRMKRLLLTYSIFHYPWLRLFGTPKMSFHHNWSQDIEQFWSNF